MRNISVAEVVGAIVDSGTFVPWEFELADPGVAAQPGYSADLAQARAVTGEEEAVASGEAFIGGQHCVLLLGNFDFLAGSVGRRACQIVIATMKRAQEASLPVFASPASGGTRMQEGTPAFVLMADVAAAVSRFRAAGGFMLVWLRHPTTGGVMATWGSLGSVTIGQPHALAGFLGPRVFEKLTGEPFPPGVQTTDNLARVGVIDEVVDLHRLADYVARALVIVSHREMSGQEPPAAVSPAPTHEDPWHAVLASRSADRSGVLDLVASADIALRLSGTAAGERSDAIVLALCRFGDHGCVLVGQDRAAQLAGIRLNAASLRTARRGFALAAELGLALVTVIDTDGAELSVEAEEGALAGEIARCLADLTLSPSPTISVLLGMGCGGAALALLPADVVIACASGWVSPLPLEGASIIRYRTPERAADMARSQHVGVESLVANGIVDEVVAEDRSAAGLIAGVRDRVIQAMAGLTRQPAAVRLAAREHRYGGGLQ